MDSRYLPDRDPPFLDVNCLEKIRYFSDPVAKAIADAYFESLPTVAEALTKLHQSGESKKLSAEAHRNLGSCLCLGLVRLASALVAAAADPDRFDAAAFGREVELTVAAVARFRGDGGSVDPR